MGRKPIKKSNRFTPEYKKSKTDYINTIFSMLIDKRNNGKDYTVFMITNWMHGRNENAALDDVFEALMRERDPIGYAEDQAKLRETVLESDLTFS